MRSILTIALISLLPVVLGAPSELIPVRRVSGPKKANSYIVTFKNDAAPAVSIQVKGPKIVFDERLLKGFAAELTENELNQIRARPDVESIEEDAIATTSGTITQTTAPWGLQRISQDGIVTGSPKDLNFIYKYDSVAGQGVDVYVIDTGININHVEFEGRARWGATFGGYKDQDGNGHGTHCAGTIGGSRVGVAKKANLIAVKVLSDDSGGAYSDVISGMAWTMAQALSSERPSIASMSLGGPPSPAVDKAVAGLTAAGVHVIVAAGNSAQDADYFSPARAPSAITVAASDINDKLASFSNYGKVVDIIAPGVDIYSAWKGSTTAYSTISGTSMACPHVAGLAAYWISQNGNQTPADLAKFLTELSVKGAIKNLRSDTYNALANNEF